MRDREARLITYIIILFVKFSTRNSNTFNVNVNIRQQSKVTFNLTYEELLTRRLGKYEQVINIVPDQVFIYTSNNYIN